MVADKDKGWVFLDPNAQDQTNFIVGLTKFCFQVNPKGVSQKTWEENCRSIVDCFPHDEYGRYDPEKILAWAGISKELCEQTREQLQEA